MKSGKKHHQSTTPCACFRGAFVSSGPLSSGTHDNCQTIVNCSGSLSDGPFDRESITNRSQRPLSPRLPIRREINMREGGWEKDKTGGFAGFPGDTAEHGPATVGRAGDRTRCTCKPTHPDCQVLHERKIAKNGCQGSEPIINGTETIGHSKASGSSSLGRQPQCCHTSFVTTVSLIEYRAFNAHDDGEYLS